MDKPKILIVEDDEFVAQQMKWALAADYEVFLAEDRLSGLEVLKRERPSIITLDLGLPPSAGDTTEGFLALGEMLQSDPLLKVMVITGQDEQQNALDAIGQGAYDFFCKPVDMEALKTVIGRAVYIYELEKKNRQGADGSEESFEGMLGKCPRMQSVFQNIRKVAATDAPVLISGESGTGKELAARAIHRLSSRKNGPFVAINCGAIPESLLESELFGHEKGSFTGAHIQREGRLETANKGTLFLDEIGEISPTIQVKILRFLQEHVIERVGGRRAINLDVRVICATNVDLQKAMAEGKFREDLYYRIGVVNIAMPPLRDRNGDIMLLAESFLRRIASEYKKTLAFNKKAQQAVETYGWPGNVRELENRLRRAVIMVEGKQVTLQDLSLEGPYAGYEEMGLSKAREAIERDLIERAIARNRGNLTKCADDLQIARSSLYELIEKLGISRK
ncbi:MAG: PEP-CTERM-box response regulator transcription factor [Acidobacteria bacterium]|nr:PEP-CTERM-box response regulator transcription factor [Acidobacteriota bacterium]